jgi:imidazolonepropionase-like amidohydrolase
MDRIAADLLIPGIGDPIRDGVVVLEDQRISYAGPAAAAPDTPGAVSRQAATVMPGMWDCHGHFLGSRVFDLGKMPVEPLTLRAVRSARDLRAALDAGITSVREVGGLGIDLARVVAEGVAAMPTCTPTRSPGWRTSLSAKGCSGWPTARTAACARSGSNCAATRG